MGIVVSVKLPECDMEEFEQAVEGLLRSYGAKINKLTAADGHTLIRAYKEVEPAVTVSPVVEPTVELPPAPVDTLSSVEPALDPIPVLDPIKIAFDLPPAALCVGEVCLKDLSSVCAVPFHVDPTLSGSVLKVKELAQNGDYISFVYCGMTCNVPAASAASGNVSNSNPQYADLCIRAMCEFVGTTADLQPILFKLEIVQEGEGWSVVFGADAADIVARIMEKVPANDSLSTK